VNPYCDYHPAEPAKWSCPGCQHQYCSACMPDADRAGKRGFCPHCNQSLKYHGSAGQVEPFWTRIRAFFLYPLRPAPLSLIALCTFVPAVLSANIVGAILSLLLVLALFKYTYSIVQHTAEGNLEPPALAAAFTGSGFSIIFKQFAVFFLMGGLVTAAGMTGGGFFAILAAVLLILALPASVIILAMEERVLAAINPVHLAALIARIGWPYIVLYAHLVLMALAGAAIQSFAISNLQPWLGQLIAGFTNSYFTLIFFHMLGYLLLQYQGQLGFASDIQETEDPTAAPLRDRSKRLDADLDMALKDGRYDKAETLLLDALKRHPGHTGYTEKLFRLLEARDDHAGLYRQHRRLLPWLLERMDGAAMAFTMAALEKTEPGFRLHDAKLTHDCARLLYQHGNYLLALHQLRDFHKRFPEYDNIADAYLIAAKALANGMRRFDKASAFLRFIQKKCAGHPVHASVEHYLAQAEGKMYLKAPDPAE